MSKGSVVIGLSGGVDSSTAAYLLKKDGYDVTGVTVINHDGGFEAADDAAAVAGQIGIKHMVLDYRKEFSAKIKDISVGQDSKPMCNVQQRCQVGSAYGRMQ